MRVESEESMFVAGILAFMFVAGMPARDARMAAFLPLRGEV